MLGLHWSQRSTCVYVGLYTIVSVISVKNAHNDLVHNDSVTFQPKKPHHFKVISYTKFEHSGIIRF